MRKLRVCFYGGTEGEGMPVHFVSSLAEQVLLQLPAVIVTGGYVEHTNRRRGMSTDSAALEGARRVSERNSANLATLFEAWVPDPSQDARRDSGRVVRMSEELGITVRQIDGRTSLGRRLTMVSDVDLVVTFAGKRNTEVLLERAIDLGVPAFPVVQTGGASQAMYKAYKGRIRSAFDPQEVAKCITLLRKQGLTAEQSVGAVVDVLCTARIGRCLVLQPYRDADDTLYETVIRPAVEREMTPVRLKDSTDSRQIYSAFSDAVAKSMTIIADLTELNANVMYEVGYAHGHGLHPLLFTLSTTGVTTLPVYLRSLQIHPITKDALPELIGAHLRDIKRTLPSNN